MSSNDLINQLDTLPSWRGVRCQKCGTEESVLTIQMYFECPTCGWHAKLRGLDSNTNAEDLVIAAFKWALRHGLVEKIADYVKANPE